jgi:hypothetical protein
MRCLHIENMETDDDNASVSSSDSILSDVSDDTVDLAHCISISTKKNACYEVGMFARNTRYRWLTKTHSLVPETIVNALHEVITKHDIQTLRVFTEVKHLGKVYRAHPNYRGGNAWYDWAFVKFALSDADKLRGRTNAANSIISSYPVGCYPAKLLAIYRLNNAVHCLIHCTSTKLSSEEDSCLTERWYLEYESKRVRTPTGMETWQVPLLRHVEVESIVGRVIVLEESPGLHPVLENRSSLVIHVKETSKWKQYFTET